MCENVFPRKECALTTCFLCRICSLYKNVRWQHIFSAECVFPLQECVLTTFFLRRMCSLYKKMRWLIFSLQIMFPLQEYVLTTYFLCRMCSLYKNVRWLYIFSAEYILATRMCVDNIFSLQNVCSLWMRTWTSLLSPLWSQLDDGMAARGRSEEHTSELQSR